MLNLTQLRAAFWRDHPNASRATVSYGAERHYTTDTRVAWCDFIEAMQRSGQITQRLANSATLMRPRRRSVQ